ncbi:Alpha/Beta hydrolase protein [Naviculisporaceae sp. PSN 640]
MLTMRVKYLIKPSPPLSSLERIALTLRLLILFPIQAFFNVVRCCLIAYHRNLPIAYYIICGITRVFLALTPRQIWHFSPTTKNAYLNWLTRRQKRAVAEKDLSLADWLKPQIQELPDGESSILWVGERKKAKKVVYFLHGGGYFVPINNGHLEWCVRAYVNAGPAKKEAEGRDVAVAILQYTLSPRGGYPLQLFQAAAGLAHILRSGVRPGDIIFGGDSAGGNLTAQLMCHLLHPHPGAEQIKLDEPIAGIFVVSPWVSNRSDSASFRENKYIDMLTPTIVENTGIRQLTPFKGYKPDMSEEMGWAVVNDVEDAKGWLAGLDKVTRNVYVTVGAHEVLRDQGIEFADNLRAANPGVDVRLDVGKNEAHDFIMVEAMCRTDGDAIKRMKAWTTGVFWK